MVGHLLKFQRVLGKIGSCPVCIKSSAIAMLVSVLVLLLVALLGSALPKSCLFLAALATIGLFGLWLTHVIAYGLRVTMFESRRSSQFEIGTEMARRKMLVRAVSAMGGMAVMTLASVALPKSHWPTAMKWPATSLAGVRGQDMGRARAVLAAIAAGGVVALRASPPPVVLHC